MRECPYSTKTTEVLYPYTADTGEEKRRWKHFNRNTNMLARICFQNILSEKSGNRNATSKNKKVDYGSFDCKVEAFQHPVTCATSSNREPLIWEYFTITNPEKGKLTWDFLWFGSSVTLFDSSLSGGTRVLATKDRRNSFELYLQIHRKLGKGCLEPKLQSTRSKNQNT